MATTRYAPQWRYLPEDESVRPSAITSSDIVAAWLGVFLMAAAALIAIFFR